MLTFDLKAWIAKVTQCCFQQYTTGIWTVRKYANGTAECWGTTALTSYNMTNSYGSLYYVSTTVATWPSGLFITTPCVNVTRANSASSSGLINVSINAVSTTSCSGYVYNSVSGAISVQFCIHAIGKWK